MAVAVIVRAYFRLQPHRAGAVAMAHYRKLAGEAVANQQELRTELAKLSPASCSAASRPARTVRAPADCGSTTRLARRCS